MFNRFKLALVLVTLIPCAANASSLAFSQRVYDAFDHITDAKVATSDLATALELSTNPDSEKLIREAMSILGDFRNKTDWFSSSNALQYAKIRSDLQAALRKERVKLDTTNATAVDSMKRYLLASLFPGQAIGEKKLHLRFENISDVDALALIGLYQVDARAVKYDDDVSVLITGGTTISTAKGELSGSAPNSKLPKVVFILPPATTTASSPEEAQSTEKGLNAAFAQAITPQMPIRAKARTVGNQVTINLEVYGYHGASYANVMIYTMLQPASGNRYLFKLANGAEAGSDFFARINWFDSAALNAKSQKVSQVLSSIEDTLRGKNYFGSGRLYAPDETTILKQILSDHDRIVAHETAALEKAIAGMKASGATAAKITERQAQAAKLIQDADTRLADLTGKVNTSISDLKANPTFAKLSREAQEDQVLALSKKITGEKFVPTIRWGMMVTSGFISAYYGFELVMQTNREPDRMKRQALYEKYGSKIIASLMFMVPQLGEAEFTFDTLGIAAAIGLRVVKVNIKVPTTEDLIYKAIDVSLNRHSIQKVIAEERFAEYVPALPTQDGSGNYVDQAITSLRSARAQGLSTEAARQKLVNHLQVMAHKYLIYTFVVLDATKGRYDHDADAFCWDNARALNSAGNGYFDTALTELSIK